jgi:hypothetical protein
MLRAQQRQLEQVDQGRGAVRSPGRLRLIAAGLLGAAAALSGCGAGGGDGDLFDDWKPVADAKPAVPPTGACYETSTTQAYRIVVTGMTRAACDQQHTVETFHVGQLPDDIAAASVPPAAGSTEYQRAFAECEKAAKEFLGDEWFNGRLHLVYTLPLTYQWEAGARHYRCDLVETKSQAGEVVKRTGSLRDGLSGSRPVANTCFLFVDEKQDVVGDLAAIDCAQAHDAEYVGTFEPGGGASPPAEGKAQEDVGFPGCRNAVVNYLGATGALKVGYMYWGFDPEDWKRGDKRVRCYATGPDGKKLKGSVKGIGDKSPLTS